MSKLIRLVYLLALLAVGSSVSWYFVSMANSKHAKEEHAAAVDTVFVDHIAQLENWFGNFRNRERHFHGSQDRAFLPLDEQSACLTCHELFPHKEDRRRRSFLNQHSHFMSCLACHLKPEMREHSVPKWTDFGVSNSITKQGGYGLGRDGDGHLTNRDNFISKIVPVYYKENTSTLIFTPYGDKLYRDFREAIRAGEAVDRDAFRKRAEENVGETALGCADCHHLESEFPWDKLGFSEARVNELRESSVVGMVEDYEGVFYFPPAE